MQFPWLKKKLPIEHNPPANGNPSLPINNPGPGPQYPYSQPDAGPDPNAASPADNLSVTSVGGPVPTSSGATVKSPEMQPSPGYNLDNPISAPAASVDSAPAAGLSDPTAPGPSTTPTEAMGLSADPTDKA